MQLTFLKSQRSRKKQRASLKLQALRRPSPFDIPEVLAQVFSYLDENTLRMSVIPVCRLWLQMNCDRLYNRDLAWDWAWGPTKLEKTLTKRHGASRLYCYGSGYGGEGNTFCTSPIMRTMVKLQTKHEQLLQHDSSAISMFRPLRELNMNNILLPVDMTSQFKLPSTLTSLKIAAEAYSACKLRVDHILSDCPLLEVLHISKPNVLVIDGPWVPASHDRQQPFRLQTLVIKNAKLHQSSLEDLLTLTPDLQELKLLSLAKSDGQFPHSCATQPGDAQYDWNHLFEHIKSLPITLHAFQFSVHSQAQSARIEAMEEHQVRQKAIDVCPKASEWSLLPAEVTPGLIQELVLLPNIITTLEIVTEVAWCQSLNRKDAQSSKTGLHLIHQYLCESPHLVHLKIIRAVILFEDLDLYNRARYEDLNLGGDRMWGDQDMGRTLIGKRMVWACRNLETLQIQIHAHSSHLIWPVHSRIIFGYISAVCPNLQELNIYVPSHCSDNWSAQVYQPQLFLQLDGGICFLSRLERLRKLKVIYGDEETRSINCQEYELNWISSSGHRTKDRTRRAEAMANWTLQLEAEETLERRFTHLAKPSVVTGEDLTDQLRNLGLLSEVKKVVEEMDQSDGCCLPLLERVSFHDAVIERRPDTALRMMFPRLIDLLR
ncbi:hypothetical protein K457DRAFT_901203 [Linnemannia elongata AG-77]|uniref:F-box domain-containing protein n=1 Tax=Linnemannia elongata AG-77 TaxID=1314771 RepID=A0A197KDZ4_9FUNG|nr:hypothetical protein K457DRAFT_901203 [Linnemannia elongata AG-77]